eukprot:2478212-Pyramimonas_sp.AAC.1
MEKGVKRFQRDRERHAKLQAQAESDGIQPGGMGQDEHTQPLAETYAKEVRSSVADSPWHEALSLTRDELLAQPLKATMQSWAFKRDSEGALELGRHFGEWTLAAERSLRIMTDSEQKKAVDQERADPFINALREVATLQVRYARVGQLQPALEAVGKLRQRLLDLYYQADRKSELRAREQDAAVLREIGYTLGLAPGPQAEAAQPARATTRSSRPLESGILKLISRVPQFQCSPGTDIPFGSELNITTPAPGPRPVHHAMDDDDHDPSADLDAGLDDRDLEVASCFSGIYNSRDEGTNVPCMEPLPDVARAQNSVPGHRGDCAHEADKTWTKDLHVTPGADGCIPIKDSHVAPRNPAQFLNAVSSDLVARTYQRAERYAQLAWKATRSQ